MRRYATDHKGASVSLKFASNHWQIVSGYRQPKASRLHVVLSQQPSDSQIASTAGGQPLSRVARSWRWVSPYEVTAMTELRA
jgi:hypothetical protein